jgi:hypothetical protein
MSAQATPNFLQSTRHKARARSGQSSLFRLGLHSKLHKVSSQLDFLLSFSSSSLKESHSKHTDRDASGYLSRKATFALGESPRTPFFSKGMWKHAAIEAKRPSPRLPRFRYHPTYCLYLLSGPVMAVCWSLGDHMDEDMSPRFFALASSTGGARVERGKLETGT